VSEVVVMVTTSYPRFPGDSVGTFMEPIAKGVAARGHKVHVVAPWHPLVTRRRVEDGVHFHFYRYAPLRSLNVFGYASAMKADVSLRLQAFAAAPLALAAGWRAARTVARRHEATIMHGHWVIPGGVTAAAAASARPLVISLHGSDVYVAERHWPARVAAKAAFRRAGFVTACSADLAARAIALGADPDRMSVVPYGVDSARFRPDANARATSRAQLGVPADAQLVAAAGRLVRKKGFEYLIDAIAQAPDAVLAIAGEGTLREELRQRASSNGIAERVRFLGDRSQDQVATLFAAADVIVAPSVRDDAGNVDGLPNVVMEALASGTPLITTRAGGIGAVVEHQTTALIVAEKSARAIADELRRVLGDPPLGERIGLAARVLAESRFGWDHTAAAFESAYLRAIAFTSRARKKGGATRS
jgi:glycosyltransferase involved in cell wall biosynthesis